jgi:hypothetical protein
LQSVQAVIMPVQGTRHTVHGVRHEDLPAFSSSFALHRVPCTLRLAPCPVYLVPCAVRRLPYFSVSSFFCAIFASLEFGWFLTTLLRSSLALV